MIQDSSAIHNEMLCCLKPDQNNYFDMSHFCVGNDMNKRWLYNERKEKKMRYVD